MFRLRQSFRLLLAATHLTAVAVLVLAVGGSSHYRTEETGVAIGETEACLTGKTLEGMAFEG